MAIKMCGHPITRQRCDAVALRRGESILDPGAPAPRRVNVYPLMLMPMAFEIRPSIANRMSLDARREHPPDKS